MMEKVLEEAFRLCPTFNVTNLIHGLYNSTKFEDKDNELARFACEYIPLNATAYKIGYSLNGSLYVIGFPFGLVSAILAIVTFSRREFDTVSFFYHRVINIIELVYMLFVFENALSWMTGDLKNRSWLWCQFLNYFHYKLDLALPLAIELIIIWVAIERVTVCFTSPWFQMINRKPIAYLVVITSMLVSIMVYVPTVFVSTMVYNNATGKYFRRFNEFSFSSTYRGYEQFSAVFSFVRFVLMITATVATITGLIRISKRKRKLMGSSGPKTANSQQLLHQININTQLCLIQLCESAPVMMNCLVLVIIQSMDLQSDPKFLVTIPYEEAIDHLRTYEIFIYLGTMQTAIDMIEHATHFYRYLIFSRKVQTVVKSMFKKNAVSQITINTTAPSKYP